MVQTFVYIEMHGPWEKKVENEIFKSEQMELREEKKSRNLKM